MLLSNVGAGGLGGCRIEDTDYRDVNRRFELKTQQLKNLVSNIR